MGTKHTLPKMSIDPSRPGIIRWGDDGMTGMLAGMHAAQIVAACNAHEELVTALRELLARAENFHAADVRFADFAAASDAMKQARDALAKVEANNKVERP